MRKRPSHRLPRHRHGCRNHGRDQPDAGGRGRWRSWPAHRSSRAQTHRNLARGARPPELPRACSQTARPQQRHPARRCAGTAPTRRPRHPDLPGTPAHPVLRLVRFRLAKARAGDGAPTPCPPPRGRSGLRPRALPLRRTIRQKLAPGRRSYPLAPHHAVGAASGRELFRFAAASATPPLSDRPAAPPMGIVPEILHQPCTHRVLQAIRYGLMQGFLGLESTVVIARLPEPPLSGKHAIQGMSRVAFVAVHQSGQCSGS